MKNIIFVAGLDDRTGDLDLTQQTALISKGYGPGADIASFRYKAATGLVTKSITDNPGAVIILFSAGCAKSKAIADHLKSINKPLNLLHINEPYTCSVNTANIVNSAITLGVPKTNVYSGGSDCTGNNISGHGKLVGRTSHFQSLTPLGKLIASLKPATPVTPAATPVTAVTPPAQAKSVIATGPGKDFINKFNEELEKVYTKAATDLGPWKKSKEETKVQPRFQRQRKGTWPEDPTVKTIGDLFAYVFFDPDGANYKIPPFYVINNYSNPRVDEVLKKQYEDWIDDMNGVSVSDPEIGVIFKSLSWPYNNNNWTGNKRNSTNPITLSPSAKIIQNYNEIKKLGITNPDKYSAGQWWFDMFMSQVIGLNGFYGYLKSKSDGSTNERIEEVFRGPFLDNNKKIEGDTNLYTISVSKFVKGETVNYPIASYPQDRHNYTDYGSGDQESSSGIKYPGYGFAKILELIERQQRGEFNFSTPPNIEYGGFGLFDSLKTQYRPGVNSLESLSKDPLFNPLRTSIDDIVWTGVGKTQSQETKIYWEYPAGTTASVVGNFENILLYNAFLEAGDDYKTITIPKYAPVAKVDTPVTSTLTPTTESKFSGEFTFNVEKEKTFVVVGNQNFTLKIGDLAIEGLTTSSAIDSPKTIDLGDGIVIIDDGESDEDIYFEESFQGSDELAQTMEQISFEQDKLPPDTPPSSVDIKEENINYNDPSFKGEAWKNFDISIAITKINATKFAPKSIFLESLKKVLYLIKNDPQITDLREGAYVLGTAFGESSYSLQRWEADYACKLTGVKYGAGGPCEAATNYYRSTKGGKQNYYNLGTDSKGVCFFGRGLIQLTGKGNYEKYGKLIGVDLLNNGDLAMDPINSYKVTSVYMVGRTFKHVRANNLTQARKSVNGGTKGIDDINAAYNAWVNVLKESKAGAV